MGRGLVLGVISLYIIIIGIYHHLGVQVGVLTGTSMLPTIKPGSLIVCLRADPREAAIGEVWAFTDSRGLVLHRVIGKWDEGLIFRGDNNPVGYEEWIPYEYVRCKMVVSLYI